MKLKSAASAVIVICTLVGAPAFAIDLTYFDKQSCAELVNELTSLTSAEKAINSGKSKKDSEAAIKSAVGFLLTGWPFWGSADHGNADAQIREIREDIRFTTRAIKSKQCPM